MRLPSGDTRGCWYGPAGRFRGSTTPFRSISATFHVPATNVAGPGTKINDPVSDTLKCAAPVTMPLQGRSPDALDDRCGTSAPHFQPPGIERDGEERSAQRVHDMPRRKIAAVAPALDDDASLAGRE